jgi:heat shock protein HslJ
MLILLVASIFLSACGAQASPSIVGTWKLTAYGPKDTRTPAVTGGEATLTFESSGSVTGNGGCNSLGGTYKVDSDQITFSEIVSTLMACDDARMAQESAVAKVLSGTARYEIKDNTLTLTNGDMVLIFTSASNSYPAPGSYPAPSTYP